MAWLARHIISTHPRYYRYYSEREFLWAGIKQMNRNPLLASFAGADGMKTGHTAESGYGLTGTAVRDGRRIIMVINGLTSEAERAAEANRILDLAFREFQTYALFDAGASVGEAAVFAGQDAAVSLIVREPVNLIMRRASREGLKAVLNYQGPIAAPVRKGARVGTLTITAPGAERVQVGVYSGNTVPRAGILQTIELGLRALTAGAGG
jgi:D-alanyl-D-alanine carboxypeptidase (penicillin-binding protein 5/6)